jgi:hypothetical protein
MGAPAVLLAKQLLVAEPTITQTADSGRIARELEHQIRFCNLAREGRDSDGCHRASVCAVPVPGQIEK